MLETPEQALQRLLWGNAVLPEDLAFATTVALGCNQGEQRSTEELPALGPGSAPELNRPGFSGDSFS